MEQIVKVGSFIQGMHNVGKDRALRFHALRFRDVLIAEQDTANLRIAKPIDGGNI